MNRNNNMGMGLGMRGLGGGGGGGGPLMTDHLQDLELELELLKRKRQLIQDQMTYGSSMGQRGYNQPREPFEDRFGAAPRGFSYSQREPDRGPKRPVAVWDSPPGPKRPRLGAHPAPLLNRPQPQLPSLLGPKPLMNFYQRPQRSQPPTFHSKFNSNFNNTRSPPKKANPPAPKKPNPTTKSETASYILKPDETNGKIDGRIGIAVGAIVKDMKAAFTDDEHRPLFVMNPLLRVIKQAVRERIRNLMMGKPVGMPQQLLDDYRRAFPPSTDVEILNLAKVEKADLAQKTELAINLLEEGDPELYFKKNVSKLLEVKLSEMFKKIESSYKEKGPATSKIVENLPEVTKPPTEESLKDDAKSDGATGTKHPKEEEYDKWMALLLERKLPELLAKHKDEIIKVLDLDDAFRATKAAIILNANNKSLSVVKAQHETESMSKMPAANVDDPEFPKQWIYYAKVHASPSMPRRKLMQDFLQQFSPKSIKRHKKNVNLLFVGFEDKDSYEQILKANLTVVGKSTITIVGNGPKTEQPAVEVTDVTDDRDSLEHVLTPQLDDQIDDLLTSIRKADEEAKANETNGANGHDSDVQEVSADAEVVAIEDDEVAPLSSEQAPVESVASVEETPSKANAPATPSTIRTRRASRLAQNN